MSNLKRSKPDQQAAVLRRLQEISSSRLELERGEEASLLSPPPISVEIPNCSIQKKEVSIDRIDSSSDNAIPAEMHTEKNYLSSSREFGADAVKSIIPDLKITLDNDETKPSSCVSSASSSPRLTRKNLHRMKGLFDSGALPATLGYFSPQPSPPSRLGVVPPLSPKTYSRLENCTESRSLSSSPTSPSRKYFRLLGSPTLITDGVRRGSEPHLDGVCGRDLNEITMSMTDRRWEKLRSILVAMKNEPLDFGSVTQLSSATLSDTLKENIDTQEELSALRQEVSTLHTELKLKDVNLEEALYERNSALAYIRNCELNSQGLSDQNKNDLQRKNGKSTFDQESSEKSELDQSRIGTEASKKGSNTETICSTVYSRELEILRKDGSTKEDVVSVLKQVVEELRVERSYLNHLMCVVLERAPWMLDEVDKGGHWTELLEDGRKDVDIWTNSSDDEVWC